MSGPAAGDDLLLLGRVSDVGVPGRRASAVLVRDGRIAAVGGGELAASARAAGARVLDFGERYLSPGFVDPHAHLEVGSRAHGLMADCRVPGCRTVEDVLEVLSEALGDVPEGEWLQGQANLFYDQKLADGRFPTRQELDAISRDVPIAIRAGGHTSILNTRAFELSDVVRYEGQQAMMGGAVIERDSAGELTGLIGELDKALPMPEPAPEVLAGVIERGGRDLFTRFGVTTIGEISDTAVGLSAMDGLMGQDRLPVRLSVFLWAPGTLASVDDVCAWREHLSFAAPEDRLHVQGLKMFADGGYSARNAATRTPYQEPYALSPGSRGKVNLSEEEIADALRKTRAAGLQFALHANGERAQEVACRAAVAVGPPSSPGLRLRLEHGGNLVTDPATEQAWREADALPMPQPVFLYNFGAFFPRYLGDAALGGRFPFRTLLDHGWPLSGSSDLHLGSEEGQTNPLFGIWCCLRRQDFFGEEILPEERITFDEAYRMHTLDAAAALDRADELGSIEVGKLADLAVLERDPSTVPIDELPDVRVDHVLLEGRLAYTRAGLAPPGVTEREV
jgi:predicted amidohydrolase YtcJ